MMTWKKNIINPAMEFPLGNWDHPLASLLSHGCGRLPKLDSLPQMLPRNWIVYHKCCPVSKLNPRAELLQYLFSCG
jgi:hypothetical protein